MPPEAVTYKMKAVIVLCKQYEERFFSQATGTISSENDSNNNQWIPHRRTFKQSNVEQKDSNVEMDAVTGCDRDASGAGSRLATRPASAFALPNIPMQILSVDQWEPSISCAQASIEIFKENKLI
ncbi:hypothetical protein O3G_MSEX002741 [Manduca sexta]|uniref:Uncharacterized protein n=1 Tax=Manduca sexta TaxID=7130 RepID=A0A921YPT4_MANSE|nr:hypothetical protein O3G_MSEX002741 [Manduca sexta]